MSEFTINHMVQNKSVLIDFHGLESYALSYIHKYLKTFAYHNFFQ